MFVTNDPTPASKQGSNYMKNFQTPSDESECEQSEESVNFDVVKCMENFNHDKIIELAFNHKQIVQFNREIKAERE